MSPDPRAPILFLAGTPSVQNDAGVTAALPTRDAALLAWLALEGPTPRTRLAQLLWPDSDGDAARNALRQRLFHLRRQFGDRLIVGHATLSLAEGVTHDLADSDSVLGAGDHGLGEELSAWLGRQRGRRQTRWRESLAELADMAEQARDFADALTHAHELLALQPLSEEAHRRVMRLHYLAGDRAAALLAFDQCEQVLKHEVGAPPAPETLALLAHIEAASHGPGEMQPHVLPASLLRPPRDIGRDTERLAVLAAWNAEQSFVLLGESGIGKSRLLESLAAAWPGTLIVGARPGDEQVPLAVVSRLVGRLCVQHPALMHNPMVRDLRDMLGLGTAPGPAAVSPSRPAPRPFLPVLHTMLAAAMSETTPPALLFDDWQFADSASVDLLDEVLAMPALRGLRRGHASRTLAGPVAQARVASLLAGTGVRSVSLQPLELAAVAELVTTLQVQRDTPAGLAQALVRRVGGNPLHILEALRHMLEKRVPLQASEVVAPAHVKQLVVARLTQLPDAARQLVRVAAVAGVDFSVELAEAVSGRGALELWDDWSLLEGMGLFDATGMAHDLYTDAVQDGLPAPIGRVLHARVAAWLEGRGGDPARLAAHWCAASDGARALPHLLAAARKAWFAARAPEAFEFFRRAAEIELARARVDQAFDHAFDNADAMSEIGTPDRVVECLRTMEPLARTAQQVLRVRLVEAVLDFMRGDVERGLGHVISLLSEAIALGDARVECECRFAIANRAVADGRFDDALQHLAAGERLLRDAGDIRRAHALSGSVAMVLGMRGQPRLAIREHERLLPLLLEVGDHATWTVSCAAKAVQHIRQGDATLAYAQVRLALESAARASIAPPDTIVTLRNVVEALRWCGRFDEALQACDEFRQRIEVLGDFPRAGEPAAQLYLQLGRVDLARPLLSRVLPLAQGRARERLRLRLLSLQAASMQATTADFDWPDEVIVSEDIALAAEWVLWSGLQEHSPWPLPALQGMLARCREAELSMLELPIRALVARRLHEAGATDQATALLDDLSRNPALHGLHAATPWAALYGAQALHLAGRADAALVTARAGVAWLQGVAQSALPTAFRDSYLNRQPVNRELQALAGRLKRGA